MSNHFNFTKKITALRELYEETCLFPSKEPLLHNPESHAIRSSYINEFKGDFIKFCKMLGAGP